MASKKFSDIRKEFPVREDWVELEGFQGVMISKNIGIAKIKGLIEETILYSVYNDNVNEVLLEQNFHIFLVESCTNIIFAIADRQGNASATYDILENSGILDAVIKELGEEYKGIKDFLDIEVAKVNHYYSSFAYALEKFTDEAKEILETMTNQSSNMDNLRNILEDVQSGIPMEFGGNIEIPELEEE